MDHTPGQRQFTDVDQQRNYAVGRRGLTDSEFDAHIAAMRALSARVAARHEAAIVAAARRLGATLASHDDTTAAHVAASAAHGARIAEFPTTLAAARACRAAGIAVIAGAPNLLRGGSHSGNVSAHALADAGLLDILSSDYAPASLLAAAVALGQASGNLAAGLAHRHRRPGRRRRPHRPRPPRPRPRRRPPPHPPRPRRPRHPRRHLGRRPPRRLTPPASSPPPSPSARPPVTSPPAYLHTVTAAPAAAAGLIRPRPASPPASPPTSSRIRPRPRRPRHPRRHLGRRPPAVA